MTRPIRHACAILLIALLACTAFAQNDTHNGDQNDGASGGGSDETPPAASGPLNLTTPQACVENFLLAARSGDYNRAAESLNFRLLDPSRHGGPGEVARRFFFVLNQELWIDWDTLPDRPDGAADPGSASGNAEAGLARRNVSVGSISLSGRAVPVRVQRTDRGGSNGNKQRGGGSGDLAAARWQFSANTVANIPALYEAHGPSWLQSHMPEWAKRRILLRVELWKWISLTVLVLGAPFGAYLLTSLVKKGVRRVEPLPHELLDRYNWPLTMSIAAFAVWLGMKTWLNLPSAVSGLLEPAAFVACIAAVTWLVMKIVGDIIDRLGAQATERFHEDGSDGERRLLTQLTVARHASALVVAVVGIGVVLVQLDLARVFGVTLLSSAGVAAVIFGIAGHAVLGNLIAGLQIALTQPFKIGDTVYVEDNWGTIERVAYTYVVVNTWDERRLVFPIRYFTSNWFENWSLEDTYLVKPIYLHVDYAAPVDKIREKFIELCEADDLHDDEKQEPEVLVTETRDETIVVRLTCGAATVSDAWTLHCRVREQLIAWLGELDGGRYLPRRRLDLVGEKNNAQTKGKHRDTKNDQSNNDNEQDDQPG